MRPLGDDQGAVVDRRSSFSEEDLTVHSCPHKSLVVLLSGSKVGLRGQQLGPLNTSSCPCPGVNSVCTRCTHRDRTRHHCLSSGVLSVGNIGYLPSVQPKPRVTRDLSTSALGLSAPRKEMRENDKKFQLLAI